MWRASREPSGPSRSPASNYLPAPPPAPSSLLPANRELRTAISELRSANSDVRPVKATDDYSAKVRMWLENPVILPWTKPEGIPCFPAQKFRNHDEFGAWKNGLLAEIAARGGVTWKSCSSA